MRSRRCAAERLDALGSLVDKSLVRAEGERFGMLETIHEYAGELLDGDAEAEGVRRAHAAYYVRFVQSCHVRSGRFRPGEVAGDTRG